MNNRFARANFTLGDYTGTAGVCNMLATHRFNCNTQTTKDCKIRLATYMLKMDVYQNLAYKYTEIPLLFPIQLIDAKDYTSSIGNNDPINSAMTVCLRHCDTVFTVFKEDNITSTQRFTNPALENYKFNIDGNFYPREGYHTIDDPRNENQTLDALNVNNSNFTSLPADIRSSMQPYNRVTAYQNNGALAATANGLPAGVTLNFTTGDWSNFFIGIPFCDNEVFQGGISTNGSVQVELVSGRKAQNTGVPGRIRNKQYQQPVSIWMQDAIFKIRAAKPAGRPQHEISTAPVEQIIAAGGLA
jgi:hypothetical protein